MEPKKIDVAPEMLEKSLRCCAEENPAPAGHEPCEDCYLWQLHLVKGGRVSTGETCFQNLVGEAFACVRRLNDFDQSQSKILLEKLEQAKAENAQLRAVIIESDPDFFKRKCRVCGCGWDHPCNDNDFWIEDDLCSACAEKKHEGVI